MQPSDARPCKGRNNSIDTIKGMLVIMMVVYHSASMSRATYPQLWGVTISIDFLHYAFILITGFVCGWHYSLQSGASLKAVSKRLRVRAEKILALVIALNVFLYATGFIHDRQNLAHAVSSLDAFLRNFVLSINGELVAAEILVHIALFLFVASFLVNRVSVPTLLFILLMVGIGGYYGGTAVFMAIGLIGMVAGMLADRGVLSGVWTKIKRYWWLWPILLTAYLSEFTLARRIALMSPFLRILLCAAESCLWFLTFLVLVKPMPPRLREGIAKLGEYTLFAYLTQMFIVRIGYLALGRMGMPGPLYLVANVLFSSVIVCLLVATLHGMRHRHGTVNGIYRIAFQ